MRVAWTYLDLPKANRHSYCDRLLRNTTYLAEEIYKPKTTLRDHGGGGTGPYHFFCLGLFLGLQMTWIFYECYHLKATIPVYSCICTKSKALQSCAATVSFSSWDATRAAKCLEAMLKIWCFEDIRSVVTKFSEPEAKLV